MTRIGVLTIYALAVLAAAQPAAAQDDPKVGITMGYPGSIGVLWHLGDRVAVRPQLDFARSTLDDDAFADDGSDSWSIGSGVDLLFYIGGIEALRTYVSPGFQYARTSSTIETDVFSSETTSRQFGGSGMFGAQYQLGTRFGVFGEVGVRYSRQKSESTVQFSPPSPIVFPPRVSEPISLLPSSESEGHAFGTTAGIGVVFYF